MFLKNLFYFIFLFTVTPLAKSAEPFMFNCVYRNGDTHQLTARPVVEKDLPYFQETYGNARAMSTYMDRTPRSEEEIIKRFHCAFTRAQEMKTPWGVWLLFKGQEEFLGLVKLEPTDREGKPFEVEISYVIHPDHWKKGICTGAVHALMEKAERWVETYQIDAEYEQGNTAVTQVYATANPDFNPGSCKVLEKNGFDLEEERKPINSVVRMGGNGKDPSVGYGDPRSTYVYKLKH